MRPPHKLAEIIKAGRHEYSINYIKKYNRDCWKYKSDRIMKIRVGRKYKSDRLMTIKAFSFRDIFSRPRQSYHDQYSEGYLCGEDMYTERKDWVLNKLFQHDFEITEERMKRINYAIGIKDYQEFYGNFTNEELACLGW